MKKVLNYLSVIVLSLLMSQAGAENDSNFVSNAAPPYLEIGSAKFFNEEIGWGTCANSFLPIWQRDLSQLLFLQVKGNTAFGKQLSGSLKLGYRSLYGGDIGLFGIHGGYDYLRSRSGHNYHQLTFGIENWFLRCFTRVNIYLPFGKNHHRIGPDAHKYDFDFNGKEIPDPHALERDIKKRINLFHEHEEEGLFCGADAAVGYELLPGLTITVGSCVETGKKPEFQTQLKYQFDLKNQRILNFFDQITCETGLRKSCGKTSGYLGISLGVNCAKGITLSGVARHLNALVATRELQLSRYTVRENLGKEKENLWITGDVEVKNRNVQKVSKLGVYVKGIEYLPNGAGTSARMGAYWSAVMPLLIDSWLYNGGFYGDSLYNYEGRTPFVEPNLLNAEPTALVPYLGLYTDGMKHLPNSAEILARMGTYWFAMITPANYWLHYKEFYGNPRNNDGRVLVVEPKSANANSTALELYHGENGLGQQRNVNQYSLQVVIDQKQSREEIDGKADVVVFQNSTLTWKEDDWGVGYCKNLGKCWPSDSRCLDCKAFFDEPLEDLGCKYATELSNLTWNEDVQGAGYCEYLEKCWPFGSQCLDCKAFFDKSLEEEPLEDFGWKYATNIPPTLIWKESAHGVGYYDYLGKCWPSNYLDCGGIHQDSEQDSIVGVLKKNLGWSVKPIRAGIAAWVFGSSEEIIKAFCRNKRWCVAMLKGEVTYAVKNVPKLGTYGSLEAALTSVPGEAVKVQCGKLVGKGNLICKFAATLTKASLKKVANKGSQLKFRDLWETTKKTIMSVEFASGVANIAQSSKLFYDVKYQVAFSMMDTTWNDMRQQPQAESEFGDGKDDYINRQREFYYNIETAAYCIGAVAMVFGGFIPVVGPSVIGVGSWLVWGSQAAMMATTMAAEVLKLFN